MQIVFITRDQVVPNAGRFVRARKIRQLWKNLATPVDFSFTRDFVLAPSAASDDLPVYPEQI